jgi:hypothetical protein
MQPSKIRIVFIKINQLMDAGKSAHWLLRNAANEYSYDKD